MEGQGFAVGAEVGPVLAPGVVGQAGSLPLAVGGDAVEIPAIAPVRQEGDGSAVGGPDGRGVHRRVVGQADDRLAVGGADIHVPVPLDVGDEGEPIVGRTPTGPEARGGQDLDVAGVGAFQADGFDALRVAPWRVPVGGEVGPAAGDVGEAPGVARPAGGGARGHRRRRSARGQDGADQGVAARRVEGGEGQPPPVTRPRRPRRPQEPLGRGDDAQRRAVGTRREDPHPLGLPGVGGRYGFLGVLSHGLQRELTHPLGTGPGLRLGQGAFAHEGRQAPPAIGPQLNRDGRSTRFPVRPQPAVAAQTQAQTQARTTLGPLKAARAPARPGGIPRHDEHAARPVGDDVQRLHRAIQPAAVGPHPPMPRRPGRRGLRRGSIIGRERRDGQGHGPCQPLAPPLASGRWTGSRHRPFTLATHVTSRARHPLSPARTPGGIPRLENDEARGWCPRASTYLQADSIGRGSTQAQ